LVVVYRQIHTKDVDVVIHSLGAGVVRCGANRYVSLVALCGGKRKGTIIMHMIIR